MHYASMDTLFIPMFGEFDDVARDAENRYFDLDHVPQRLMSPGFIGAERYELCRPVPHLTTPRTPLRYLNVYAVESPEALLTDAYAVQSPHRSPRRLRYPVGRVGPSLRQIWQKRPAPWQVGPRLVAAEGPATLLLVAFDTRSDHDVEDNAIVDNLIIPTLLAREGVLACDRYECSPVSIPGPASELWSRHLSFVWLAAPEAASFDEDDVPIMSVLAPANAPHLAPAWCGVYMQRPSPWSVRPAREPESDLE